MSFEYPSNSILQSAPLIERKQPSGYSFTDVFLFASLFTSTAVLAWPMVYEESPIPAGKFPKSDV